MVNREGELSEEDVQDARDAVATWRVLKRTIAALLGVLVALFVWGVTVEKRLASMQTIDENRDKEMTIIRNQTDHLREQLYEHRAADRK